jgi:hypothetical protein
MAGSVVPRRLFIRAMRVLDWYERSPSHMSADKEPTIEQFGTR